VPAPGLEWISNRAPISIARSRMPRIPCIDGSAPGRKAAAVVAHREHRLRAGALEAQFDSGCIRVTGDVGQGLLRHAVHDELLLLRERNRGIQLPLDPDSRLLAERRRQRGERALQTQVLERLGAQLTSDPAHVLGVDAGRFPQLVELLAQVCRDPRGQRLDLQHHAGQRLADRRAPPALPSTVRRSPHAGRLPQRDRGIELLLVFFATTVTTVVAVTLVGAVDQWWVLVPVMLVPFVVTFAVIATIVRMLR
jgi:hypothetical protein